MRLAVRLYTLRERLSEDLEGTLEALAATGVREVELDNPSVDDVARSLATLRAA